ncbi:MAG TPA: acetate kinase [Clostridia bacterium]|jgi:acetate kinase|nr:acetate kinase [Clostridia bacterium]
MKILVINCGSSSLKYQLFEMHHRKVMAKGIVERIGERGSRLVVEIPSVSNSKIVEEIKNIKQAANLVIRVLTDKEIGSVRSIKEISAVGHRIVHGGSQFSHPVIVDTAVKRGIELLADLAPLHNVAALEGINAFERVLPEKRQVVAFDTSFHQTIPKKAYLYSIPYRYYERYGIRKYGFHGLSHKYVAQRAAELLGRDLIKLKLITCHLGSGASVTAVDKGKSIDTSMGFTPLEGLTMGTRSGDIDPSIISFLVEKEAMPLERVKEFLNKECGVLGVSGISSDFRDLESLAKKGDSRAILALDVFVYDVKRYISAYIGILNGIDALVFTAGIGENSSTIRQQICENMTYLGLEVDAKKNKCTNGNECRISTSRSKPIFVIPTNEELMIALETQEAIRTMEESFA